MLQTKLTEIRKNRLNGCFVRSRSNWIDNNFCNLEKQQFSSKAIPFIEKEDGAHIYNQNDKLHETKVYYEKLYI